MRWLWGIAAALVAFPAAAAPRLDLLPQVHSQYVAPRDVHVFVPDQCRPAKARCKVVYMMDGQNLFTPSPWSHADWGVAETLPRLINAGKVPPAIVVGVDNIPARTAEYMPRRVYDYLPADYQARVRAFEDGAVPNSDAFLKFLITELKPRIDAAYHTRTGPRDTAIIGSSSGGHIALYAQGEYPRVFGASASLSMPWLMVSPAKDAARIKADTAVLTTAWRMWLRKSDLKADKNRIYSDQGTAGLDGLFTPYEVAITTMFRDEGWPANAFSTPVYEGAEHNETAWRQRLDVALVFVLNR